MTGPEVTQPDPDGGVEMTSEEYVAFRGESGAAVDKAWPCMPSIGEPCGNCHRCTSPEVTAAMKSEDVDPALVEKACRARWDAQGSTFAGYNGDVARTWDALASLFPTQAENYRAVERHALAAVLPEIQAQARKEAEQERDAARAEAAEYLRMASSVSQSASRIVSSRAARLAATTEEPK